MKWEEVVNKREKLKKDCEEFLNNKMITQTQFNKLLSYLILLLYTDIPPRRNQDYSQMYVVGAYKDGMDNNKNYFDFKNKQFIFNTYKTSKKYGKQVVDLKDSPLLLQALDNYLKFHPLNPKKNTLKIPEKTEFKLLVNLDGSSSNAPNSITRVLNKIFDGKKIGSSMLRHIYLSSKYDINEMKKDSEIMAHSLQQQKDYLKYNEDDLTKEKESKKPQKPVLENIVKPKVEEVKPKVEDVKNVEEVEPKIIKSFARIRKIKKNKDIEI
jgi:hypothetical protein